MIEGWIEATGMPPGVRAGTATRNFPGFSEPPYGPANFSDRCGDDAAAVARNRASLCEQLGLRAEPLWLRQVHGTAVWIETGAAADPKAERVADACIVRAWSDCAAVVLSADCLPIILASVEGEIAAIHAGWRGLAAGVIENTLARMTSPSRELHTWLGPAIGHDNFEVGPEVRAAMLDADPGCAACFVRGRADRWYADLYALAQRRLQATGVIHISGGGHCTVSNPALHSFRDNGVGSGRMASLVWNRSPGAACAPCTSTQQQRAYPAGLP